MKKKKKKKKQKKKRKKTNKHKKKDECGGVSLRSIVPADVDITATDDTAGNVRIRFANASATSPAINGISVN